MSNYPVKGLKITAEGELSEVKINGLDDLQEAVGGLIEGVYLNDGGTMWVNEEFLLNGSAPNYFASDVAGLGGRPDLLLCLVRGDVVIVGPADRAGDETNILETTRRLVMKVASERV